jgi:hypothetical protein
MLLRNGALLIVIALFATIPARAQGPAGSEDSAQGYLNAFACGTLPQPVRIHVEVMDNTDENLKLKDLLERRLRSNGVVLSEAATLVLSLEAAVSRQATRLKPGDMVDVRIGRDEPNLGQEGYARVHMNIWSTTRDSLLTGRRSTVEEEGFDLVRLRASLNSREDGRCLWQGEIVHELGGEAPYRFAPKLIPLLADSLGKAVSRKPVHVN